MWPYLLGVYPVKSTKEERAAILREHTDQYEHILGEWQRVEHTKKEIEKEVVLGNDHRSGSVGDRNSPALSFISGSDSPLERSFTRTPDRLNEVSDDLSCDQERGRGCRDSMSALENGVSHDNGLKGVCNGVVGSGDLLYSTVISKENEDFSGKHLEDCSPYQSHDDSHDQSGDELLGQSYQQSQDESCDHTADNDGSPLHLLLHHNPEELVMSSQKLDSRARVFVKELYNIDKDIPRCDRDYW